MRRLTVLTVDSGLVLYLRDTNRRARAGEYNPIRLRRLMMGDTIDTLRPSQPSVAADTTSFEYRPRWGVWKELPDSATILLRWGGADFQEFYTLSREGDRMVGEGYPLGLAATRRNPHVFPLTTATASPASCSSTQPK